MCTAGARALRTPHLAGPTARARPPLRQVVRCFDDDNVVHVAGRVDPVDDVDTINFELALADITQAREGGRAVGLLPGLGGRGGWGCPRVRPGEPWGLAGVARGALAPGRCGNSAPAGVVVQPAGRPSSQLRALALVGSPAKPPPLSA